jgi:hypothetical protein
LFIADFRLPIADWLFALGASVAEAEILELAIILANSFASVDLPDSFFPTQQPNYLQVKMQIGNLQLAIGNDYAHSSAPLRQA